MFTEILLDDDWIVAYRASGKLTDADYQQLLPALQAQIDARGRLSLLIELQDFDGWDPQAAWDDLKFGLGHDDDFDRIAVVGESAWQHWMTVLSNAFVSARMRYFEHDAMDEAVAWLKRGSQHLLTQAVEPYRHVMLATDFSIHAEFAAKRAAFLAKQHGARLSLVTAVDFVPFYAGESGFSGGGEMVDFGETVAVLEQRAKNQLQELAAKLDKDVGGAGIVTAQLSGAPVRSIIEYAEQHEVDLIVLGSHGHRGLARLLGSVANGVLQAASCDVLAVRL